MALAFGSTTFTMDTRKDRLFNVHDNQGAQALAKLQLAVKVACLTLIQADGVPPMTTLKLAAMAVGAVYAEVATAHRGTNHCPCGWEPHGDVDVQALLSALALSAEDCQSNLKATAQFGHA